MTELILFLIAQAWVINGVHIAFKGYKDPTSGQHKGNVFYLMFAYKWSGEEWWQKPLYSCVKCMASLWGAVTFWPVVVYFYGFHWEQIFIFVLDVFALAYLNWIFYKL